MSVDPSREFVVSFGFLTVLVVVAVLEVEEAEHVEELEVVHHTVDVLAYLVAVDQEVEVESQGTADVAAELAEERDADVVEAAELVVAEVVRELLVLAAVQGLAGRSCRLQDP